MLDVAGVKELLDEGGCGIAVSLLVLHHLYLRLHGVVVGQSGLLLLLQNELSLLVIFDLLLGAAALAAGL